MQNWEYLTLIHQWDVDKQEFFWGTDKTSQETTQDMLNKFGKEGWDLVAVRTFGLNFTALYHFKRPAE